MDHDEPLKESSFEESASPEIAAPARAFAAERSKPQDAPAPPCFFSSVCRQRAAIEKAGRSVCRECAKIRLRGGEYSLRGTATEPLYVTGRAASEALDMVEEMSRRARRGLRGGTWA